MKDTEDQTKKAVEAMQKAVNAASPSVLEISEAINDALPALAEFAKFWNSIHKQK